MILNYYKSNEYRKSIHDLIPGGAHTYSKGDDQFPILSPAAIFRGKGAYVWDIDGNKFLDNAMGLTSVSLGHAFEPILVRVREELERGVNFQRPSYIEREMAEKFLDLLPMHDRIKFAKNGSTVTTAAIKLARAYTGKKGVAFPKEQPFFSYDDWFIASTACNKGIPIEDNSFYQYSFGDLDSLENTLIQGNGDIAAVISEPGKSDTDLSETYLKACIELAHKYGAVFILDEMITGFKVDFPGAITKFNLKPDLATWGKGIANGFSFCALTGKNNIMDLGGITEEGKEKVFLTSSTHGGETHAIAAGMATIDFYQSNKVLTHNQQIGNLLIQKINDSIDTLGMRNYLSINNTNWFLLFSFFDKNGIVSAEFRTLFMQEMIKRGVLFNGLFSPCYSHTVADIEFMNECFISSAKVYMEAIENGVENYLVGPSVKPVFRKFI